MTKVSALHNGWDECRLGPTKICRRRDGLGRVPAQARPPRAKQRCNHPLALVVDRTERELRELEVLLSNRPNCSRWTPENGPIIAVLSSAESQDHKAPEDFT